MIAGPSSRTWWFSQMVYRLKNLSEGFAKLAEEIADLGDVPADLVVDVPVDLDDLTHLDQSGVVLLSDVGSFSTGLAGIHAGRFGGPSEDHGRVEPVGDADLA